MCTCVMAIKLDEIQERMGDQKPVYQLEWPYIKPNDCPFNKGIRIFDKVRPMAHQIVQEGAQYLNVKDLSHMSTTVNNMRQYC